MARRGQIWKIDRKTGELVKVQDVDNFMNRVHYVVVDIPEYRSPATLKMISGRTQRREDLIASGCREVDPGEKRTFLSSEKIDIPDEVDTSELVRRYNQIENMTDEAVLRERQLNR